jgi:disulfide bond formation protein DsbB
MKFVKENYLQFGLLVSAVSTAGSLIFSEILKFPPCVLCWYQRIFMYPLVAIFAIGIWKKDKNTTYFALPLAVIGFIIAVYHNLLYYKIIPESAAPCTLGISCTTKQIEWLGFITIPFLSLTAFAIILVLTILQLKLSDKK